MDAALHAGDAARVYDFGELFGLDQVFPPCWDEIVVVERQAFRRWHGCARKRVEDQDESAAELRDGCERVLLTTHVIANEIDAEAGGELTGREVPLLHGLCRRQLGNEVPERRSSVVSIARSLADGRVERVRLALVVRDDPAGVLRPLAHRNRWRHSPRTFGRQRLVATRGNNERERGDSDEPGNESRSTHTHLAFR